MSKQFLAFKHWTVQVAFWAVLAALVTASADAGQLKVLRGHVPQIAQTLSPTGSVSGTNEIHLAIGIPLRDPAGLDQFLAEVYDPASPLYHHYLTPEEFAARFSATGGDYEAVKNFAATNGFKITGTHGNRLLLDVTARAADVERAFHLHLKKFQHPTENREFFAPDTEPTVDATLAMLDVQGLSDYSRPRPRVHHANASHLTNKSGSAPDGSGAYFGNDFRAAYLPGTTLTGAGQMVGLLQFDGFYANDIASYANAAGGGRSSIPVQAVLLDGYNGTPGSGNVEVSLDIEMAMSMAPGLAKIIVFEAGPSGNPNDVLNTMAASNTVKNLSCSWGWSGGPNGTTDNIFKTMAAQGQSFFNASGDSDAFTIGSSSSNGVDNPNNQNAPSSSPYITQVGATTLNTGSGASYSSESAWNWGYDQGSYVGTSGGVSSYYPIPSWQSGVSMSANLGSTTQRNIPDVALTGDNVYVVSGGNASGGAVGGTSCAAPLWAGFMALVNQQAAAVNAPAPGFINPAIYAIGTGANSRYSYATCFHDVAAGNNEWPSSASQYPAVAGYDLCTGWGTPSANLINALTVPPDPFVVTPTTGFSASVLLSSQLSGGPETFTLTNAGSSTFTWSLINTSAWISLSSSTGVLAPGQQTSVTAALTSAATNYPPGTYTASVVFSNQATQVAQARQFSLLSSQSLLQNGGFETGDFTGWTLSGSTADNGVEPTSFQPSGVNYVHSGNYGAALGQTRSLATLSQIIPTVPGQNYQISMWINNPQKGSTQVLNVSWLTNGSTGPLLYSVSNPIGFSWTKLTYSVTALAATSTLQIAARNDPNYFGLDDVSVIPIPAPNLTRLAKMPSGVAFSWSSLAGVSYVVQYKTNLTQANWTSLVTNTASGTSVGFTNTATSDPRRFFRVVQLP